MLQRFQASYVREENFLFKDDVPHEAQKTIF